MLQRVLRAFSQPILLHGALVVGLFAVILIAFGASLNFGFAAIDDTHLIVQNLAVRDWSLASLRWIFSHFDPELYIPITFLSFQIEHLVAGLNPWVFHLDNLLLHTANSILVFFIGMRIFHQRMIAVSVAILFALHPIQTEAVVWISGRKDLLATFFGLSALLLAWNASEKNRNTVWIMSIVAFLLSLLSKPSMISLPIILFALFMLNGKTRRESLLRTLPFLLASIAAGIIALLGKSAVVGSTSLFAKFLLAGSAIAETLGRIFFPINLSPYYASPDISSIAISSWIGIAITLLLGIGAWMTRKRMPELSIGILWFLLFLLPTVLNIQADSRAAGATFAADRYVYSALIGLLIAVFALLKWTMQRCKPSTVERGILAITILLSLAFLPLTRAQTRTWKDASTLFSHAVSVSPASITARTSLARVFLAQDNLQGAFDLLKEGLAFGDDARLHVAAGSVLAKAGQVKEAEEQFSIARTVDPTAPEPLFALGELATYRGEHFTAQSFYESAIDLEPCFPAARRALASLLIDQAHFEPAEDHLRTALRCDPHDIESMLALASLLTAKERSDDAATLLQNVLLLDPANRDALEVLGERSETSPQR